MLETLSKQSRIRFLLETSLVKGNLIADYLLLIQNNKNYIEQHLKSLDSIPPAKPLILIVFTSKCNLSCKNTVYVYPLTIRRKDKQSVWGSVKQTLAG